MHLLAIVCIICVVVELIKESFQKPIPAENWANKDLIQEDRMRGMSEKDILKNVERGRYKPTEIMKKMPGCHKDSDGKKTIENCVLYNKDLSRHGAVQTYKWVDQGKYNLTVEELKKEEEKHFQGPFCYIPKWAVDVFYKKTKEQSTLETRIEREVSSDNISFKYINCLEEEINCIVLNKLQEYDLWCVARDDNYKNVDYIKDKNVQNNLVYIINVVNHIKERSSVNDINKYLELGEFLNITVNCSMGKDYLYSRKNDRSHKFLNIGAEKDNTIYRASIYNSKGFDDLMKAL